MTHNPICVNCQQELRPWENGVIIEDMFNGDQSYKLWMGDTWHCGKCGLKVVIGFGQNPLTEHFQPAHKQMLEKLRVQGTKIIKNYEI